ncbi:metallophosphoesterase [Kordiimonas sp.]|uniref:metallophosphoesterase n=1 Tax=Kordiimonas sp. TaxID=1970157 RepID=UPI003B51AC26
MEILHISDLHLRKGWAEEQGQVLAAFFEDLKSQCEKPEDTLILFTGDLAQQCADPSILTYYQEYLGNRFRSLGFRDDFCIFVPGNHDIDRNYVVDRISTISGLQDRPLDETAFNSKIYGEFRDIIFPKFKNFIEWQRDAARYSLTEETFCGAGFSVNEQIGVYVLNTALFSCGGAADEAGETIEDYGKLAVETRNLNRWLQETKHVFRVLAMHHPIDWMNSWAQKEIKKLTENHFDLVLCGHTHEGAAQELFNGKDACVYCVAPALFTRKSDVLGYSLLKICAATNSVQIKYRHWHAGRFLPGVIMSNTEDGVVKFGRNCSTRDEVDTFSDKSTMIAARLEANFRDSLKYYESIPQVWVNPTISDTPENSNSDAQATLISVDKLVNPLKDTVLYAPPQFGLSALGHYLAQYAWKERKQFLIFVEARKIKNYEAAVKKYFAEQASSWCMNIEEISGIILDDEGEVDPKKIKAIKATFPNLPIILLSKLPESDLPISQWSIQYENWSPQRLFLWSLTRQQVRQTVSKVISLGSNMDEDEVTQTLVDDLEVLNLHRTPLNCLTLLAVYRQQNDFRPANRTDMIEKFLYLVFGNHKKRSDYSEYPDMKDSLYVLGAFSEMMIREEKYTFTPAEFSAFTTEFCYSKAIDIDVLILATILRLENIIIEKDGKLAFKFAAWVYFFAAHRMYHSDEFREYICSNKLYMNFPEVIEFYTGIDRRRNNLIALLTDDLRSLNDAFEERSGIQADFDPFNELRWSIAEEDCPKLRAYVEEEVLQSNLPLAIKDEIADQGYDRSRPYRQSINHFTNELSLRESVQVMRAASRALRNSDYIEKEDKVSLLKEITRTMRHVTQTLVIFGPVLASDRFLSFENMNFRLGTSFDGYDGTELLTKVVTATPFNVVNFYEKDISSSRISTLLIDYIESTDNEIEKLLVSFILIRNRSKGWKSAISSLMRQLGKNSFYLFALFREARRQYQYGFCSLEQKSKLKDLLGVAVAKHETGARSPSQTLVKKVGDKVADKLDKEKSAQKDSVEDDHPR